MRFRRRRQQTDVQVQAAAGVGGVRFGHEGGLQVVFSGHALHRPAEHHALVGGRQGLVAVVQVYFELAGGVFRRDRTACHALLGAGFGHLVQVVAEIFDMVDAVYLRGAGSLPAELGARRLKAPAVVVGRVD